MNWLRIRELVRKEFISLLRDPRNRRVLIIAPIIQILVFGYVVNYDIRHIRVAFLDQARTRESRMLMDNLLGNGIFDITHHVGDSRALEDLLLRGKVDLGIKVAPDMSRKIRRGETAEVQILADGSMSNMASVRIAYTVTALDTLNRRLLRELHPERMDYGRIDARIRTWYNPNLDSQHFFVPGIVAFVIMLISLLLTSIRFASASTTISCAIAVSTTRSSAFFSVSVAFDSPATAFVSRASSFSFWAGSGTVPKPATLHLIPYFLET